MLKKKSLIIIAFIVIGIIFVISPPTLGIKHTDMLIAPHSLDELTNYSYSILIGRVTGISSVLGDPKFVDASIEVVKFLKNPLDKETIGVRTIKSSYKEFIYEVRYSSIVDFKIDERVLLFLGEPNPSYIYGDNCLVFGVHQGKVLLENGFAYYNFGKGGKGNSTEIDFVKSVTDCLNSP